MPRLNIKSTKAALIKLLKQASLDKKETLLGSHSETYFDGYIEAVTDVALQLEIEIKPEDYKQA